MANPAHVELLRQGVEVWNKWRKEHPDVLPDLIGVHLKRAQLMGADLIGANLKRAQLMGADLTGAQLDRAQLIEANLKEADLTDTHLTDAYLTGAYLTGAHLTGAYLKGTYLKRADLKWADLSNAWLYYTSISSAWITQADFTEAQLMGTIFADMDLSEARGLETVRHVGPSSIGADTILKSKGEIPEIFLRGAGLSDDMILYIRSLRGRAIEFYSCFISYSHKDMVFARRLYDTLQGKGIRCWLDEHQILPGDDLFEQLDRGIKLWDKVLLCCSEASLTSWWVNDEIERAFAKEQKLMRDHGRPMLALIPLNLDGYLHKWDSGKAEPVRARFAPSFEGWEHDNSIFEKQVERVVKALMTEDAGRELPPPIRL
ncbi:MAG TPA: toll/interleukin-1 receptor domain-containing protein [Chloroflexia bacterium]|jgi:hypothetical protein